MDTVDSVGGKGPPVGRVHGVMNEGLDMEDYLHPQGQDIVSMANPIKPNMLPSLRYSKNTTTRAQHFDSGVADLDGITPNLSHPTAQNGKPRPPSTKNYDYADYGGHQYEELPQLRAGDGRQKSPESCSEYQSSSGTTTVETPSESGDTSAIVRNADERKRYNPLYDAMVGSSPNIYNKVKATQPNNAFQQRLRMMKIIVILLILISCLSLAISLYIIIVYAAVPLTIQSLQNELNDLHNNYSELNVKMHYMENMVAGNSSFEYLTDLSQRVSDLKIQTTAKINNLELSLLDTQDLLRSNQKHIDSAYGNASQQINITQHELVAFQSNFTSHLNIIQSEFDDKLSIISKMPGPQGPPGVGNLSACYMRDYSMSSASQQTDTQWEPDDDTLQANVIMFVLCEVRNGVDRYLEMRSAGLSSPNMYQFRCLCSGMSSGATSSTRTCITHLWLCPRESFGGS